VRLPASDRSLECYRLSGGGNDFLALAEPTIEPEPEEIRAWCTRGLSLGADGLFTLERVADRVRMNYFNADGRPAALCLNGTRCAARLAARLGWTDGSLEIETGAGIVQAEVVDDTMVRLVLDPPQSRPEHRTATVGADDWQGWYLLVGVPQFVLLWPESLAEAPVTTLGAALRRHSVFGEAGANIMFTRVVAPDRFEIRSYERGVEAETLACGTGVLASAAAALHNGLLSLPTTALTGGGFEFEVAGQVDSEGFPLAWSLAGDARLLARLDLHPGARAVPAPPVWT